MGITLEINSCQDCPRLEKRKQTHFLIYPAYGYHYICTQIHKTIMPSDGVNPPPKWCPKRKDK